MTAPVAVKEQVIDNVRKRIKELKFGIATSQDIVKQGVIEVCDRDLYDLSRGRAPNENGPLDLRLGLSGKEGRCETCGQRVQACMGHFGYTKLVLPVLHVGYLRFIIHILQVICKSCSSILLPENERRQFLRELRRPNIDNLRKTQICKKVCKEARKTFLCQKCGTLNGRVKRNGSGPMKITHERFSQYEGSKAAKKQPPKSKLEFDESFKLAKKALGDIDKHMKKAMDDLNPLRILNLFEQINSLDCELLGMNPKEGRPEMFVWQYIPISPPCLRPSVPQDGSTTEDDITSKVSDIIHINSLIKRGLDRGERIPTLMEQWDFLQAQVAMLVNSECPGVTPPGQYVAMRGFCQRLKGKQGRFRGNLSGKRVDFSGRTVISPDPNLAVDEVALPEHVAKTMTYPEKVSESNLESMRRMVRNGARKWPGAYSITKGKTGFNVMLKFGEPWRMAENLRIGDTVERHLVDGDIVLFNRQPSLHKLSIMAHRVKVRPSRTFRLNECVCTPYNADFDGDEMNVHVPQTEEARAEALELMGVKHNLATPRNGEPIIAAIQDFITGAYLLSSKDKFFDRKAFSQICSYMVEGSEQIDIPPPAILKPVMLWTGKQIFNVLLRPNKTCDTRINLDAPCRQYKAGSEDLRDMSEDDTWLCVRNSEIMCGVMDKNTIGVGKKDSVFFVILRDYGEDAALEAMNRLARLIARYLSAQGFSIGIGDVRSGESLTSHKKLLVEQAYAKCDALIADFNDGRLKRASGVDEAQTLESSISLTLSAVRREAGDECLKALSKHNAAMVMALSGSKGSSINVSQMVAVVGQQIINQERVQEGFQDRTLPHFPRHARQPPSKGFVRNSFYSGMDPHEFFFHAMSGREGLVDTAVKTAETGYMSRRLMKSLEDLSIQYDDTVRNSSGALIQYQYGDDKLDPSNMEGKARPVNLEHIFSHVKAITFNESERGLLEPEILDLFSQKVQRMKQHLSRLSLDGKSLAYEDTSPYAIDDKESSRAFLMSLEGFLVGKIQKQSLMRTSTGEAGKGKRGRRKANAPKTEDMGELCISRVHKISETMLTAFIDVCMERYRKAAVQPGTAVGAVGAQSIGEPGTQMTLKTFHFAGIANLQMTQGVPRVKEIINASKEISTPIITCELNNRHSITAARFVKGRIEQTYLRDIIYYIADNYSTEASYLEIRIDFETITKLQLDLKLESIVRSIVKRKKLKLHWEDVYCRGKGSIMIRVESSSSKGRGGKGKIRDDTEIFARVQHLKRLLPSIPVCGYPAASRAIVKTDEKGLVDVLVEGYGLKDCMTTEGVNGTRTRTNSVIETRDVLGIEAARTTIIDEIQKVMAEMDIDPRHMQLLADVMTYRGEVLGITRFGLSKMRDSVLQLASFEKTPDHLFEAAWHAKRDKIEGVSECIIMGQSMSQGTGAFQVVKRIDYEVGAIGKKPTIFEDAWRDVEMEQARQKKRRYV